MNKKVLLGFIAVFVVGEILEYLVNTIVLGPTYQSLQSLWRPDMKMGLFPVIMLIVSFFFSIVFSKGYNGTGVMEGLRYGFYIGMMMSIPYAYGSYAVYPIPYSLALQWFIYTLVQYIILGAVVSLVFGKTQAKLAS